MNKELSVDEIRVCEVMGVNPHEYIESREQERARVESLNQEGGSDHENKIAKTMGLTPAGAKDVAAQVAKESAARAPLTEEEIEVCRKLGVLPLEYYQQRLADAGLKPQQS